MATPVDEPLRIWHYEPFAKCNERKVIEILKAQKPTGNRDNAYEHGEDWAWHCIVLAFAKLFHPEDGRPHLLFMKACGDIDDWDPVTGWREE